MAWRKAALAVFLLLAAPCARASGYQPYALAFQGRMTTQVMLNGQGPFTFLIDTASSRTVIFEHARARLGLTRSAPESLTVIGINATVQAMPVHPDTLEVAGETVRDLTIGVVPDSAEGGDPDGVLGIDILSRYFVVLDRGSLQLRLLTPGTQTMQDYDGWAAIALEPRQLQNIPVNFWYFRAEFNDRPLDCLFDLGSGPTMFNWDAAAELGYPRGKYVKLSQDGLRDVTGKHADVVLLKNLRVRIDGRAWNWRDAVVSDAPVFALFDMGDKPGAIVGPGLLQDNSLAIDFAGHRLYVGPTR